VPRGCLKDTNALSPADSVLQKTARLVRIQMVEGGKERPKSVEVSRDLRSVDRVPEETNAIRGRELEITRLDCSRIFVR
jgi:hypothetical protein